MTVPLETVVVTGAAGFVGRHLVAHLASARDGPATVVGWDVAPHSPESPGAWVRCDVTDADAVAAALAEVAPDAIIHLAGLTRAPTAEALFKVNVLAAVHVLGAAAARQSPPRVVVVGTAAQYGFSEGGGEAVDETHPLRPVTPYGLTKTLQEEWALARAERLPVAAVRPFNIMGPGQPPSLVPAAFLAQAAEVRAARQDAIRVGNVETRRDFTDVRDVAAALAALAEADEAVFGRAYNIASGEAVRIGDLLEAACALAGGDVPVEVDPARLRAHDVPVITGDAARLRDAVGWRPRISWRQSLEDAWAALRKAQAADAEGA